MLVSPSEPIVLADGTKIDPQNGEVIHELAGFVEVPTNTEAIEQVTAVRKRAADLPDLPSRMNPISVVLAYELFGLDVDQTAIASGFTVDQVTNIRMLDPYMQMKQAVVEQVKRSDADTVTALIKQNAQSAASTMVGLLVNPDSSIRMGAAKDILDRAGHRPADVHEHRHKMENSLVIEHVKRDSRASLPVVDASFVEVENAS